jgi:hypothetical protein
LQKDFKKCNVLIYDEEDKQLANIKIWEHNFNENYIVVQDWPELSGVERCKLLILAAPAPYSYTGTIRKHGFDLIIKLYEEQLAENRRETRYKTDLTGHIESLVYDGKSYPLHTKLDVKIINLGRSGIRMHTKENTLMLNDNFTVRVKIGENDKLLKGKVVNLRNVPPHDEYGCALGSNEGDKNG